MDLGVLLSLVHGKGHFGYLLDLGLDRPSLRGVDMKGYEGNHGRVGTKGVIVLMMSAISPILGLIVLRMVNYEAKMFLE